MIRRRFPSSVSSAGGRRPRASRWSGCSSSKPRRDRPDRKARQAPRAGHFPARAHSVIYLFMHGGPSHLETFDPKPDLQRLAGEPLPASFGAVATRRKVAHNPLLATKRTFRKCGQSGIEISDFLPHLYECADDLAVIRSCWADSVNHPQAVYEMNTGTILMGKPSLGIVGQLRPGDREPGLAVVPRLARPCRRDQGRTAGLWRRVLAGEPPGHIDPRRRPTRFST